MGMDENNPYPVYMDARFGLHYKEGANHMSGKVILDDQSNRIVRIALCSSLRIGNYVLNFNWIFEYQPIASEI